MRLTILTLIFTFCLCVGAKAQEATQSEGSPLIDRALKGIFIECLSRSENPTDDSRTTCANDVKDLAQVFEQLETQANDNLTQSEELENMLSSVNLRFDALEGIGQANSDALKQVLEAMGQLSAQIEALSQRETTP